MHTSPQNNTSIYQHNNTQLYTHTHIHIYRFGRRWMKALIELSTGEGESIYMHVCFLHMSVCLSASCIYTHIHMYYTYNWCIFKKGKEDISLGGWRVVVHRVVHYNTLLLYHAIYISSVLPLSHYYYTTAYKRHPNSEPSIYFVDLFICLTQ